MDICSSALTDCRIEACCKLQRWNELSNILHALPKGATANEWNLSHAGALLQIKRRHYQGALKTIREAKAKSLVTLANSPVTIDSYHTRYGEITR